KTSLPSDKRCSAWLRFDEEMPQYIRAILPAPLPGPSPYSGGVFAFDIMIPDNYPNVSPKVQIITTGRGKVRFGPNLYASGKVCLSLLGTWEGPKWNPKASSLFQVLVSIQSLILGVEHPFFLEP
ncbi:UBC-like protein, partial [Fragilariopsis cylindrus CCMP1102]